MNEEQFQKMLDLLNKKIDEKFDTFKKEIENKKPDENKDAKDEQDDLFTKAEKDAKQKRELKTKEELEKQRYLDSFKFNSTVDDFIKDNAEFLPETLSDIINILKSKDYATDVDKTQELKRAIVEQYIKNQENINLLPDSLKSKAEKYAGFTTKEKLERAADFYDIVETGIHTAKNIKKVEAMNKNGNSIGNENDAVKNYESKMLEFSQNTINGTGENK